MEISREVSQQEKVKLLPDLVISVLEIYLKESKSAYNIGTCTPRFIASLFTVTKLRNQPRYPSTDEWIKTMWCMYMMDYCSGKKKNEIVSFAGKWMKLEITCQAK
jgi:hypothetical protein